MRKGESERVLLNMRANNFNAQNKPIDTLNSCATELACWLVVHRCKGLGPSRFAALLRQENNLLNCFSGSEPRQAFLQWCQKQGIADFVPDWGGVEADLAWAQRPNCHILTWQSPAYPALLKAIASPPPVLFVQGQPSVLNSPQVAIVGSRHPSAQGRENAFHFASTLTQAGLTITSGLALGIDAASHEGALKAQGQTIAVLGNGLNRVYPPQNDRLGKKIAETGALVSEFPIGTPPLPAHFPRRNRLISGLSLGVLVVESTLKSGSLITAQYALEQGREVFALPGSIRNTLSKGCHHLIRQGAKCVDAVEHILEELPSVRFEGLARSTGKFSQIAIKKDTHLSFLDQIDEVCTPMDVIINRTGLTPEALSPMLLEWELQGHVASVPGGYVRCAMQGGL